VINARIFSIDWPTRIGGTTLLQSVSINGSISSNKPVIREHVVHFSIIDFSEQFNWMALLSTP